MKRIVVMVQFMIFVLISFLLFHASPGVAASDLERVEQLIKSVGKNEIITVIRKQRQNNVTVVNGGQMHDYFGPPDEKYVTAKTIVEDLKKMRLSISELEKMLGQGAATKVGGDADSKYDKARSLFIGGKYDDASNLAKEAIKEAETQCGVKSIELRKALSLAADIENRREEYQEAVRCLERLRTIQESTLGNNHRDVASTITRMIQTYEKLGDRANVNKLDNLASSRWGGGGNGMSDPSTRNAMTPSAYRPLPRLSPDSTKTDGNSIKSDSTPLDNELIKFKPYFEAFVKSGRNFQTCAAALNALSAVPTYGAERAVQQKLNQISNGFLSVALDLIEHERPEELEAYNRQFADTCVKMAESCKLLGEALYNVPRKLDSALRWQCGSGPW